LLVEKQIQYHGRFRYLGYNPINIHNMNPIRFLLFPLLLLFTASCNPDKASFGTFEAESGKYENMLLLPDQEASGGKYLSMEENSEVTWDILLPHDGYYRVVIRYRTSGGDKMQYLVKNGEEIGVGFDMSSGWNLCAQPFYLKEGNNTLGIRYGWGGMDVDRISIEEADPIYTITPAENRLYTDNPRDLVFKIDNFNQRVVSCKLNGADITYLQKPYPFQERASWLTIPSSAFTGMGPGNAELVVELEEQQLQAKIEILKKPGDTGLMVVAPDVEHGSAMLLRLPDGSDILIDCGKSWVRDSILVPMLRRNGVDTLKTFILTHYHPDHDGGDSGQVIKNAFHVQEFIDYRTFPTGHEWEQGGIHFKVLNSYADGGDENTRSLSLSIRYNGFHLVHGGDTYAVNQKMIIERFPDEVPADVFYANHHFHGSVDPDYIIRTNPDVVILQAQEAIYARAAYMVKYKKESEEVLDMKRDHPVETLPALEVGTIVLRINSGDDWTFETYRNQDEVIIPGL